MMLKVINLYCINKIFEESVKLSAKSQILYINCLIHHFKDLEASIDNSNAFHISTKEINYEKYKVSLKELENSGLIGITNDSILFYNKWDKHLPINYQFVNSDNQPKNIINFKEELLNNVALLEVICMRERITMDTCKGLLESFIEIQKVTEKKYRDYNDASVHFVNYASKYQKEFKQSINKSKSNGKLLG